MSEELTPLESAVIALSRQDPVSSLRLNSSRLSWILGLPPRALPLANPRLEALRRYAILRRVRGFSQVEADREQLREMGFSHKQVKEIDNLVDPSPKHGPDRPGIDGQFFIFDRSCFPAVSWS